MEKALVAFPDLTAVIIDALNALGRTDLIHQLKDALVASVTFNNFSNAGYIYIQPLRPLNVVEQNVIGMHHGETIAVDCGYGVNLDVDNLGRLSGIEILNPCNLRAELRRRADEKK